MEILEEVEYKAITNEYDKVKLFGKLQEALNEFVHSSIPVVSSHVGVDILTYYTDNQEESELLNERISKYFNTEEYLTKRTDLEVDALATLAVLCLINIKTVLGDDVDIIRVLEGALKDA